MSTYMRIVNKEVSMDELFDGRLEEFGIAEDKRDESIPHRRLLTDGRNWLLVVGPVDDSDSPGVEFETRWLNNPSRIIDAIEKAFDAHIFTEYEPQYWGFETDEEWDAWNEKLANEARDRFYDEVIKYVSGQAHRYNPGTIGETEMKIAKALVQQRPELALPDHKAELMDAINAIYDRDHAVKITVDEKDLAFVKMLAAHERDLPQS